MMLIRIDFTSQEVKMNILYKLCIKIWYTNIILPKSYLLPDICIIMYINTSKTNLYQININLETEAVARNN